MGLTTCISTAKEELNAANSKLQSGNHAEGALYLTNLFNTLEDCTKRAKLLGDEKEELIMRADLLELLFNGLTLAAQFINKEEFNEFLQSEELKVSRSDILPILSDGASSFPSWSRSLTGSDA